ncbi:flagellar assembly protein FliW [Paenibacillus sambharensis]|uniref:Flagellar assembly factor FliW n=1 Tax=Paenibacillus sambharensis TaxID=1803190 RepID=A0A2W1M2K3_9BACL|nr:flagellar assembly protein FliW [Paenibacillus sambharensis]PZD97837.1 flagellar assembly protein FliW [Paenibacillus sambharensis]
MELITDVFGVITVEEKDIFHFEVGIPGFEELSSFVVIQDSTEASFSYLQSVERPELSFFLIDPFAFFPAYDFELPETAVKDLKAESIEQLLVRTIVTVRDKLSNATTNLVAPIVLNMEERVGKQVILIQTDYTTRHNLFPIETDEVKGGNP